MKGFEFGETTGREGLARAVCLMLAYVAGRLVSRPGGAVLAGVVLIAGGVWIIAVVVLQISVWFKTDPGSHAVALADCKFPMARKDGGWGPACKCKIASGTYVYLQHGDDLIVPNHTDYAVVDRDMTLEVFRYFSTPQGYVRVVWFLDANTQRPMRFCIRNEGGQRCEIGLIAASAVKADSCTISNETFIPLNR
jgi:hypothetical protein